MSKCENCESSKKKPCPIYNIFVAKVCEEKDPQK